MVKTYFVIVLLSFQLFATAQKVTVLNERKLSLGLEGMALKELQLTRHPGNDNHLLLTGMCIDPTKQNDYGVFTTLSKDGGKTWGQVNRFGVPEGADPWSQVTASGYAYASVLGMEHLFIYTSKDGGATWLKDSLVLKGPHDHQTMTWDKQTNTTYLVSIYNENVYISPANGDTTFTQPYIFKFANLSSNTMTPVVNARGKVLIPFTTFQKRTLDSNGKVQREWLPTTLSWLVKFDPVQKVFETPAMICNDSEKGFPVLAIDASESAYKGRLYYVCSNQSTNNIQFHYSDNGDAWTKDRIIKKYFAGEHSLRNRFTGMPQVAVNNKGQVLVVWQDRTGDSAGKCQYLYGTVSNDGGKTFAAPFKISSKPSCPENSVNGWAGERYKSGGDYLGITSKDNGNFMVIWPDSRKALSQYYAAELKVD